MDMKKPHFNWLYLAALLLSLQIIYVYAFFIEPNWIKTENININNPRLSCLSGIKIIQISDLHIENFGWREVNLIERINKLKPDIILITGDLLGANEGLSALWNVLSLLEPKIRTYAVLGESDGPIANILQAKEWDKAKVSFLQGKMIKLSLKDGVCGVWLIGAQDNIQLEEIIKAQSANLDGSILISHRPDIVRQAALENIDLVLCGHTHGGQIGIPLLRKLFPYTLKSEYISGLYRVKNTLLYVNRGFASKKEIRFLCWPEITVFDFSLLKKASAAGILKQDRY